MVCQHDGLLGCDAVSFGLYVLATRRLVADRNRDTANRTPDFTNMELLEVCTMLLKPVLFNRYAERHLLVRDVGCQLKCSP